MSSKRKSTTNASKWMQCEKCESIVGSADYEEHLNECPPSNENWKHRFIRNNVLHSIVEVYNPKEFLKNINETTANDMIFMSKTAMELCNIALGDKVLLVGKNVAVKTAFSSNDGTIMSISLTKSAIELANLGPLLTVQKLPTVPYLAKEMIIEYIGNQSLPPLSYQFYEIIKSQTDEGIFTIGNKIIVPFYGQRLIFRITKVRFYDDSEIDQEEIAQDLSQEFATMNISEDTQRIRLYKTIYLTKWTVLESKTEDNRKKKRLKFNDIGGYSDLIAKLRNLMDNVLNERCQIPIRGILLYGSPGVGKSLIANTLISEYNVHSVTITDLNLISKNIEDMEMALKEQFEDAVAKAPSIILLEDIDILCPKKSSSSTSQERKLVATLANLFDDLRNTNANVAVLATTSKLDFVDNSLRRGGRLRKEFEVSVPDQKMRGEILTKILLKVPHTLTEENIKDISFETHGFVAADLEDLCYEAMSCATERFYNQKIRSNLDIVEITLEDFQYALRDVNPSEMKEALVQVPNVKWSEIGGQKDLKLKLKQAVEWPLKHPEAFQRMGIVPPKGVLMFGPPGCSKTMIAKALATESKLNFLNIKGPELFSKWVGDSEKAIRDIFRKARQVAPSIIFIDEIDALGGERTSSSKGGGSNVQERVLAQLLTELDGVTALGNVTLVAATNRPDRIDKALLRPGRLDRIIYVPLPDTETRNEIFSIKLKKMPISNEIIIQDLVDITEGYSGAEIQAVCHEAALKALELDLNATQITKEHFRSALSIVKPRTSFSLLQIYDNYIANADM